MWIDGWLDAAVAQQTFPKALTFICDFLNRLGKGDVLAFLAILLAVFGYFLAESKWVRSAVCGVVTLSISGIIVQTLKQLFGRARPKMNFGDWHFIGPNFFRGGFDSFPSGHAVSSFTMAAFFAVFFPRWRIAFYGCATAVVLLGRVGMRHHFLSDVVVGAALGILIGWFFAKKCSKWIHSQPSKPQSIPSSDDLDTGQPPLKKTFLDLSLVIAFASVILLTGLGRTALWDRDETEYAQAVIEMRQNQEWLIPTLEGKPFVEKPIFLYWIARASVSVLGQNEFGFRFPCALFGILTCLLTYFLGRKIKNRRTGLFSALILASSFLFVGGFRLFMTDAFFVFFDSAALLFYMIYRGRGGSAKSFLVLTYVSVGLAVLSKGPIGFFPVPIFLLFEHLQRKKENFLWWKCFLEHGFGMGIAAAIALPWFAYSFFMQKEASSSFLLTENIFRFMEAMEGHTGPMFYYVFVLIAGFLPWSFFMFPAIAKDWRTRAAHKSSMESPILLYSLWIAFIFIFFSICANKLPHYILPLLPPLACLLGKYWDDTIQEQSTFPRSIWMTTFGIVGLLLLALGSLYWFRPPMASWKLWLPFLFLTVFLLWSYREHQRKNLVRALGMISFGSLLFFVSFSFWGLPWIDQFRVTHQAALTLKQKAEPHAKVYGYHFCEPGLFIYYGKLFPKVGGDRLDTYLDQPGPVYVFVKEKRFKKEILQTPYAIVDRREGFAENSGEMTLLLVRNQNR